MSAARHSTYNISQEKSYLQLIQVTIKLLETFKQGDEIGRGLGTRIPGLNHPLLIDQCF